MRVFSLLAAAVFAVGMAGPSVAATPDHYKCYKIKETKKKCLMDLGAKCKVDADCGAAGPCLGFPKGVQASIADQFESGNYDVKKPVRMCNPVDKNGEGILDPDTHQKGYQIKAVKGAPKHVKQRVTIQNQFTDQFSADGLQVVETIKEDFLLVPSGKDLSGPASLPSSDVDHYKCYKTKEVKGVCTGDMTSKCKVDADCFTVGGSCAQKHPKGVNVTLDDQFESGSWEAKKLTSLCTPADKNGEGITNDVDHLACYQIKAPKGAPKHVKQSGVYMNNQFGHEVLGTIKEDLLCVPTIKSFGNPPVSPTEMDFTTIDGTQPCGFVVDGADQQIGSMDCGTLYLGGPDHNLPPNPTPPGSTMRMGLDCTGSSCDVSPSSSVGLDHNCTEAGCPFGVPLPLDRGALSTCIVNTLAAPVTGSLDLATGTASLNVSLDSDVWLNNIEQGSPPYGVGHIPCPQCVDGGGSPLSGSPESPAVGTCDYGENAGSACSVTNTAGLSRDCPPLKTGCEADTAGCSDGTLHVSHIAVNLSPLTTGSTSASAPDGLFCPDQKFAGCFGEAALPGGAADECRGFEQNGTEAGPLANGVPTSMTMGSTFCIPATGNALIDSLGSDLPGPGSTSLPGIVTVRE